MNILAKPLKPLLVATLGTIAVLSLSSCAPRIDTRGNAVEMEMVASIAPGTHTQNNVLRILGSPSNRSSFDQEVWYYISETTETNAFFAPIVTERQIIAIKFDANNTVLSVDVADPNLVEVVEPADGATPTAGNTLGFFEQIFANLGRFNK